jgi:hypothetical protein
LNIVPLRIKDVIKRGIVPQNMFQNHEGLNGNKIADFMLNNPESIENAWHDPELNFENSLLKEILNDERI